ncbi:MFS transporter [Cellulomonas sp. P22]|uniref:MFS transporter n=1 Tax=Cellulomonas sp. P22 TaxID=3373189 RepID=UPI0037A6AC37
MTTPHTSDRTGGVVAVLAFAGIVASLMQTLVVPLIGQLPQILGTTASSASWVVTATLLSGSVCMPVAGRLADTYGKRQMILVLLVPLVVGSVICALATSLVPMLVGRTLQGLATAMVPLGISLLHEVLPPLKVHSAMALMSSSLGIGGALGLPIAATVAELADWRFLFWGTAVLSLVVGALVVRIVPAPPRPERHARFDMVGAIGLGVSLICLLLAISKGSTWGWGSATTLGTLVAGVVVLLAWGWWELRTSDPLVDLRVAALRPVLLTNAASIVVGFALYAQSLIVPQILQLPRATGYGLGQSMLQMGLWMAPSGLAMMALSPTGARLSRARGPKATLIVGSIIMAAGYATNIAVMGSPVGLMIGTCITSAGLGFAFGSMPALILGGVPKSQSASANSFNSLMRSIGTTVSAAVVGAVLAQMSAPLGEHLVPTQAGFRAGLLIAGVMAVAAGLIALTIPVRRRLAEGSADGDENGADAVTPEARSVPVV